MGSKRNRAAILLLLPFLASGCAENAFYVTGVPDGATTVDRSYYGFTGTVASGGTEISHAVEVKIMVKAFNADGKLRVCGAYGAEVDDFNREAVVGVFSLNRGGMVFGKGDEAVSLPLNFMVFNDLAVKAPIRADCTRTEVAWRQSFSEPPEMPRMRPLEQRRLPVSHGG